MLKRLYIQDYAIIDRVEVVFDDGLNVLTGETGAGKSILIGAFGLLLGEHFNTDFIRKGAEKTIVEGEFCLKETDKFKEFLEKIEITDIDEVTIIRREVNKSGKSRIFINDSPVKLKTIKEFGDLLVDLHGQHEHQSLVKNEFYYGLLDKYGKLDVLSNTVKNLFYEAKILEAEKKKLIKDSQINKEKRGMLEFQLKEIQTVNPIIDEDKELERELKITENFEKIWELTNKSFQILDGEVDSVTEKIAVVLNNLEELIKIDSKFNEVKKYIESTLIEVRESVQFFSGYTNQSAFSPERLEEIRMRLNQLYNLKRKYGGNIADILKRKKSIEYELKTCKNIEERISSVDINIKEKLKKLGELSGELSEKRKKTATKMGKSITGLLRNLGMESGLFAVDVLQRESQDGIVEINRKRYFVDHHGIDKIEFLVATNKGEDLKPLARIASMGEISRIVLAVKSILSDSDEIPVLIFDEIDVGISGRIATAVAKKLKELARFHQIICITHIPQIASAGNTHFSAVKKEKENRVFTKIKKLKFEERKNEIAKLLGGEKITEINLKNAEELLKEGRNL